MLCDIVNDEMLVSRKRILWRHGDNPEEACVALRYQSCASNVDGSTEEEALTTVTSL